MRALAVVAACWLLCARPAIADNVQTSVRQLGSSSTSYKVRLAAALSLSKARDERAVRALAKAVTDDRDATIRRVSALALEKIVDARTDESARKQAFSALEEAAALDRDRKVRETAKKALRSLAGLRNAKPVAGAPAIFVNIDPTLDQSRKVPTATSASLTRIVKKNVERTGYATTWPGGLPTSAELESSRSRAFIVASTVKKVDITRVGSQAQIACTVAVRIAPWNGSDGGESWEANRAASASGSAKATTGTGARDIQSGVRDCLEAVAEDVTSRQVVPFLRRIASAGS